MTPSRVGLVCQCFSRSLSNKSTIDGSASVEVSPSWSGAFSAILRRMRRMIFRAGFGEVGCPLHVIGYGDCSDFFAYPGEQFLVQCFAGCLAGN